MISFDLDDKIAVITGGARGIGKEIARAYVERGARVLIADIDAAEVKATATELNCASVECDVSSVESVTKCAQAVTARFGRVDILVNNAGVNTVKHRVTIEDVPTAEWRRILAVDLDGLFYMSRPIVARMKAQGTGGRIINITSVLELVPARLQSAFVAAKAGVVNLTRSMAMELAPDNILVNAIAPGTTMTEGVRMLFLDPEGANADRIKSQLSHIPMARAAEPEEIAAAAVFLASPAASYITGIVLPVDGGWTAGGYLRDW